MITAMVSPAYALGYAVGIVLIVVLAIVWLVRRRR